MTSRKPSDLFAGRASRAFLSSTLLSRGLWRYVGFALLTAIASVSDSGAQDYSSSSSSFGSVIGLSGDIGFRLGIEQRKFTAPELNQFSEPNNSTGLWSNLTNQNPYESGKDLVLDVFALKFFGIPLGVYGRYGIPTTKTLDATLVSSGTVHKFETKFSNKMVGLVLSERLEFFPGLYGLGSFRFGLGSLNVSQTISTSSSSSALEASALSSELEAEVGLGTGALLPFGSLELYGGYARQRATAFSATSVTGTSYSGITPGKRLKLGGDEFRVNRSGVVVGLRYVFRI